MKAGTSRRLSPPVAKSPREYHLKKTYGISLAQYNKLLKSQGGHCALCEKTSDGKRSLAVDHNHETREVRGLLCNFHNHRLIGRHKDPELFRKAAEYLETHTGWFVPVKKKRSKKRKRKGVRRN